MRRIYNSADFGSNYLNGNPMIGFGMGFDFNAPTPVGVVTIDDPYYNQVKNYAIKAVPSLQPVLQTASSAASNVSTVEASIVANPLWEHYKVPICLTLGIIIGKISI